jgi:cellulose biosynthesis protein BcsE
MTQQYALVSDNRWGNLSYLQRQGLYWVNIDRKVDAQFLCKQVIEALPIDAHAALICSGDSPQHMCKDITSISIKKIPLFSLPEHKKALFGLVSDIKRALKSKPRCYLLLMDATFWQQVSAKEVDEWLNKMKEWLKTENSTVLLLSYGPGANTVKDKLLATHWDLDGLSHLQWIEGGFRYLVSWWATLSGLTANQSLTFIQKDNELLIQEDTFDAQSCLYKDEAQVYAEKNILDGIPPQSKNWYMLEHNTDVAERAKHLKAATVLFALYNDNEVDSLVKLVYALRKQSGQHLKIVVREMSLRLRISNQRLLIASGANLIVPYAVPVSKFQMMLECIQGQNYQRQLPEHIDEWLHAMLPLLYNGYLPPAEFADALKSRINNTILPENGKGLFIIMQPNKHINAAQALSICNLKRMGDIATIVKNQLILFLSDCTLNDLETTYTFIFRLPVDDVFLNYDVFADDLDILNALKKLNMAHAKAIPDELTELIIEEEVSVSIKKDRREPVALTLSISSKKE